MKIHFGYGHKITEHEILAIVRRWPAEEGQTVGTCEIRISPPLNGKTLVCVSDDSINWEAGWPDKNSNVTFVNEGDAKPHEVH